MIANTFIPKSGVQVFAIMEIPRVDAFPNARTPFTPATHAPQPSPHTSLPESRLTSNSSNRLHDREGLWGVFATKPFAIMENSYPERTPQE
jgi:hypothetical protein